jgi:hypothetical protein
LAPEREEADRTGPRIDLGASAPKGYALDRQFAGMIHQARFDQRSVGSLDVAEKGPKAGTRGRTLISRRRVVSPGPVGQPALPLDSLWMARMWRASGLPRAARV